MIPLLILILSCSLLYYSYPKMNDFLTNYTPDFDHSERQNYIVKNVMKSISLCILCILSLFFIHGWDNTTIRIFAAVYVSNDLMGMYMCTLPTSTRIHHITTVVFLFGTFMVDFQQSHIAQMLFYYTYLSAVAFPVNLYLGLRLCYEKPYHPEWLFRLKSIAKYVYCGVCIVNWSYQLFLLKGETEELIYVSLIGLIVVDDIILLKWLFK